MADGYWDFEGFNQPEFINKRNAMGDTQNPNLSLNDHTAYPSLATSATISPTRHTEKKTIEVEVRKPSDYAVTNENVIKQAIPLGARYISHTVRTETKYVATIHYEQ